MHALRSSCAALALAALATAQAPCWETNYGANLSLGDDAYSLTLPLGFSFSFAGVTYTDVVVCSNGYLWLGPQAPTGVGPDYSPSVAELTTQGPRIAPLWNDFDPSANPSGGVYFNTFPAAGGVPARAVATWLDVYEYNRTTPLSMQITLLDGGDIIIHYDTNMAIVAGGFGSNDHVVGASDGAGSTNPVNFSSPPIVTAGNPTLHQVIPRGPFPLVGKDLQWIADGNGGYIVIERTGCTAGSFLPFGAGCPQGMTAYEFFNPAGTFDLANSSIQFVATAGGGYSAIPGPGLDTNYANAIVIGDDQVIPGNALGFSFPFAGTTTTTVDVSSNGVIWVGANPNPTISGYPTQSSLVSQPTPAIAPMWQDLDPSSGGTVYWDTGPNYAMMTWVNVPYWNVPGSSNTLQVKLLSSGDFVLSYQGANNDGGCVVGLSEGNNAADPGPIDWSVLPRTVGMPGNSPITLGAMAGSRPAIGQTFNLEIGNIPAGTTVGAMIFSFTRQNPGLPLGPIGMAGCTQYLNLDVSFILPIAGPSAVYGLPLPNSNSYLGTVLYAQGATFSSGFNALGVIATNGGEVRVGL